MRQICGHSSLSPQLPERTYFAVSKCRILRVPKRLGFGIPTTASTQPTIGDFMATKGIRQERQRLGARQFQEEV